jgi:hypothetical protein
MVLTLETGIGLASVKLDADARYWDLGARQACYRHSISKFGRSSPNLQESLSVKIKQIQIKIIIIQNKEWEEYEQK